MISEIILPWLSMCEMEGKHHMFARMRRFIGSLYKHAIDVNSDNINLIDSQREAFFEKSKKLSDFVQIILSLSVGVFILIKFSEYKSTADGVISVILYHGAKISALIFIIYFAFYASSAVYYYFLSEVVIFRNAFVRFLSLVFCMLGYIGTVHGLVELIGELSRTYSK